MENPYAPPKVQEKPRPKILDLYDRIAKYQRRVFYGGLLVLLGCILLPVSPGTTARGIVQTIAALGGLAALAALLFTLPMTIWGFIKGYREGRSR